MAWTITVTITPLKCDLFGITEAGRAGCRTVLAEKLHPGQVFKNVKIVGCF